MNYKFAVYNKYNLLLARTLTRRKAFEIAAKYSGSVVKEIFDAESISKHKDYYPNGGK